MKGDTPFKIFNMKNIKKDKHILAVVLGVFIICYNWIWLNKTFTLSEGWSQFYIELMNRGKVPYKNFYYYLPPLSLFEDWVLWKMSFGYFIVYRLLRLFQRIFRVEIVYYVVSKRVNYRIAFLSGILSTVLLSANVYDLCGDYNQTQQVLVILMGIVLLKYVDAVKNNNINKKYIWITLSGVIGGLMFLQKQTIVLSSFLVFGFLLIIFVIIGFENNGLKTVVYVILGTFIPIVPTGIYLVRRGAFNEFIYQVYQDTSSKGGIFEIVFGKLGRILIDNYLLIIISMGLIIVLHIKETKNSISSCTGVLALSCFFSGMYVKPFLDDLSTTVTSIDFQRNHIMEDIYSDALLFGHMAKIVTAIWVGIFVWAIYQIVKCVMKKVELDYESLVLAFTSIAAGYSTIMGNGEPSVHVITAFIVIPIAFYILLKDQNDSKYLKVLSIGIGIFTAVIVVICTSQKLVCAYSWWGDSEESYWDKTETINNIKALKGFKFSENEKIKYEKLNELISYYADDNSVIWGFPYVKVYNLFQQNYNMNGFVPVEFYDVCADDYAKKEAALLAENMPDIVVWTDIPGCMEIHENIFRNGNLLGQRFLQKWFSDVKDTDYTLIGQVDNVFVYKLNDDVDVNYTYITRKTAKNETAIYHSVINTNKKIKLLGKGTQKSPYLIKSLSDLEYLRNQVNLGNSFEGCYFQQTCDIEMDSSNNWKPIGDDRSNQFAGIYDGNGYSIKGLYMLSDNDENLALFGFLSGTIANVSVEDAWVGGQFVALISCDGEGRVINCYSSGILYGYGGGGCAYKLGGGIYNCVGLINVEKGMISGISGHYSNDIKNCYSNMADGIDIDSGKPITEDTVDLLNEFVTDYNKENSDVKLHEWTMNSGMIKIKEGNK